jgi:hypothetical protein
MHPTPTIYIYEAMQGLVEERIAKAKRRNEIHSLMHETRARRQFRRSVVQGLRSGLGKADLTAELRSAIRQQSTN